MQRCYNKIAFFKASWTKEKKDWYQKRLCSGNPERDNGMERKGILSANIFCSKLKNLREKKKLVPLNEEKQ